MGRVEQHYAGRVFSVETKTVSLEDGRIGAFDIVRHPGGAAVLPILQDGRLLLIRQLRPAVDAELFEIPAGRLTPGEDPALCGLRELAEETGLSADALSPLGILHPSPGVFDEVIHLYLATGLSQGVADPEPYEEVETVRLPVEEAMQMAADGTITDGKTLAALLRYTGRSTPSRIFLPEGEPSSETG